MSDFTKSGSSVSGIDHQCEKIPSVYGYFHDTESLRGSKRLIRIRKENPGEPYIIHPLCVGIILADLELDKETIVAGLLHDAVEDTWMT